MKKNILLIFIFILNLNILKANLFSNMKNNTTRMLWESKMEYHSKDPKETLSLKHCAKSSYKYFSFITTGANVTFNNFVNKDNAVSIIF